MLSPGGLLQIGDDQLFHPQHSLHGPGGFLRIGVAQQARQILRHNLPRQAILVFEPAALRFRTTLDKSVPVEINLFLILATHGERNGLGELVTRPPVQGDERLAL